MTTTQTTSLFGRTDTFKDAGLAATYLLLAVWLITGYWFLHAGWTKFAFVAGEPFDASGYLGNADWTQGYVNGDLMGLLLFAIVGVFAAGRVLGVDAVTEETAIVQQRPWLRYLLG